MALTPSTAPNLVLTLTAETASYSREQWLERHADPVLAAVGWRETAWSGIGSTASGRARSEAARDALESDAPVWRVCKRESSEMEMIALGRSPRCDVIIPEPGISKLHAYLQFDSDGWSFIDAESRNGSKLDGAALPPMEAVPVRSGARITLGPNANFIFLLPEDLYDRLVGATPTA